MRTLTKDENANLSLSIADDTATVVHTVKATKDEDNRIELTWSFDFANVEKVDLLKLATRSICIRQQAAWRKATNKNDAEAWDNVTFDVVALLAETKRTADPKARAIKALAKLSPAERNAIFRELAADVTDLPQPEEMMD